MYAAPGAMTEWEAKTMRQMAIFRSIGVLGDSLSSGEFEYDEGGIKGFWDCYDQSWGKFIERETGADVTVFARGGLTAFQLLKDAENGDGPVEVIGHLFDPAFAKQAYIVALGVNDLLGAGVLETCYRGEIGDVARDVDEQDPEGCGYSYAGTMGRLILKLRQLSPGAVFFLVTMPDDGNPMAARHAQLMHELAARLQGCYVIDLFHDVPPYDAAFQKRYYCGGHMNAMGYVYTANVIMDAMDRLIESRPEAFALVQFTASGKKPYIYRPRDRFINGEVTDFPVIADTRGRLLNASDGGIIFVDGVYHWYGMALRPLPAEGGGKGGQATCMGLVMYASRDLYNWDYEGIILPCSGTQGHPLHGPMLMERPKIFRNPRTGKFVLWFHYAAYPGDHGTEPGTAEAGVAVCDTVNGTYAWQGTVRPIDDQGLVRDCTTYVDRDGEVYLIYDREETPENRCLHVVRLSEDGLRPTEVWKRIDVACRREAPCITWHDGYYYLITSALTGWRFNRARYYRAASLLGEWEDMGDPCVDDTEGLTFHAQGTMIFSVQGTDTQILLLERHNTDNMERSSHVFLPVEFHDDHTLSLRYHKAWQLGAGSCSCHGDEGML
mgnify:CR=1 FL=1